ncbi:hypothetical protein ACC687_40820, partial [Rhizobium ruizarguesonis]
PVNLFVAGFIGSPSMNFLEGRIATRGLEYRYLHRNAFLADSDMLRPDAVGNGSSFIRICICHRKGDALVGDDDIPAVAGGYA